MTQFNPQQQAAIDALGQNVMVSASAGAGKTTVLIARLMKRIIQDGVRIDEICAMTFTEAAASEMKIRLLESLNKENTVSPSTFLEEQITLVETAQISTIHSFCLTIVKNYGYILGIDPSRTESILDPANALLLQEQAMKMTLNQFMREDQEQTMRMLNIFNSNPLNFSALENAIYQTATWLLGKKNPQTEIESVLSTYRSQGFGDLPTSFKNAFVLSFERPLEALKQDLMKMVSVIDSDYDKTDKKGMKFETQAQTCLKAIEDINDILVRIKNHDSSFYDSLVDVLNFKIIPDGKNETYTELREQLADRIKTLVENHQPLDAHIKLLNKQYDDIACLLKMTTTYLDHYQSLKTTNNCLDFNDFESLALQILTSQNGIISDLVQSQYQEVMVDEFQDTNEYQDEIIRLISNGHNIFRVGDVKQSIYRFRGAKPHIMQNLMHDQAALNLFLSFNYRSKEDIVSYNNYVFDKLMNLTYGIQYNEHDHVNTGIPQQKEDSHPVEFHIIERGDDYYPESPHEQRAQYIAQQIIHYHELGYKFSDMAILVRSHGSKSYLKKAFEDAGIPHYIDDQSGFYNSEIIQNVLSLLRFVQTGSEYYLPYVLTSPFYNLTDDDLALLKINHGSLYQGLSIDFPAIHEQIQHFKLTWKSQNIMITLQEIINLNNHYLNSLSLQDKTNLDFLLEKTQQFMSAGTPTLSQYLIFVEKIEKDTSSEASPLNKDADIVTVMTIHQSKGLQFPIVFLWGMGGHTVRDHYQTLLTDDQLGIALNHISLPYRSEEENILRNVIEFNQNHEELEESLRLLYVALTRPQKHLVMVDVVKEFTRHPLSFDLLFNHKRKMDLLLAASPNATKVVVLSAQDIPTNRYDQIVEEEVSDIIVGSFTEEIPLSPHLPNTPIDLSFVSLDGMKYGTTLHNAMEILPDTIWTDEQLSGYEPRFQSILKRYNTHPFTQDIYKNYTEFYHETPYISLFESGVIDFYAVNDSHVILVDYKSDRADVSTIIDRYTEQLSDYYDLLKQAYPNHSIEAYIYSFNHNEYIKVA
ncbi:MAG: UvrD-helicase domain-containing protein [Erysipelothrix sp.]